LLQKCHIVDAGGEGNRGTGTQQKYNGGDIKVASVQLNTSDAPPASFNDVRPGASLQCFSPLTTDDFIDAVRRLPDNFSAADPISTSVLKPSSTSLRHFSSSCLIARYPKVTFLLSSKRRSSPLL